MKAIVINQYFALLLPVLLRDVVDPARVLIVDFFSLRANDIASEHAMESKSLASFPITI